MYIQSNFRSKLVEKIKVVKNQPLDLDRIGNNHEFYPQVIRLKLKADVGNGFKMVFSHSDSISSIKATKITTLQKVLENLENLEP